MAARPTIPGFNPAPNGIKYDTEDQVYEDAEELCAMHTAHDVLFLLYVSSRSALLYDRDALRNNVLLFGEHATSKSFPLTELCKKMLIHGTYLSVTSQSKQAQMTNEHTNDMVCVHEELQQSLISKHTKDSEMQDAFKDALTRSAASRPSRKPTSTARTCACSGR